jgi:hypothetical protein
MTRYIIGDVRTGRRIQDLNVLTGPWDDPLNSAETVTATIDLNDPDMRALNLRASATPAKSFLVVVEKNKVMGGPIWTRKYDWSKRQLTLGAKGFASIFDHRLIIPLLARTIDVDEWLVPDPSDKTKTMANPDLATTESGLSYGTIAKRLVQQCLTWTGGNLPVVFQDDATGTHSDTVEGVDFKVLGDKLRDITALENGPDINFLGRFTDDKLGIEWLMQTGSDDQPQVSSPSITRWNVTAPLSPVSDLVTSEDATAMASIAWGSAGRSADTVLVSRQIDDTLTDAGYPLMETLDTSHTSVEYQSTLDKWTSENLITGQQAQETWTFDVEAYPVDEAGKPAGPQFGSYSKGDYCELDIQKWDPETKIGDPYYAEGGTKKMRIIGLSGDEKARKITVKTAPVPAGAL